MKVEEPAVECLATKAGEETFVEENVETKTSVESTSDAAILSWESAIAYFANAEPLPAAGIAGVIVIFLVSVFGNIGALVVGSIAGALLHASIDRRKLVEHESWKKERLTIADRLEPESSEQQTVYPHYSPLLIDRT